MNVDARREATRDVTGSLWRALAVLRIVLLGFAVALNLTQWRGYAHPVVAWGMLAGLAAWSLVTIWFYATPRRRYRVVLAADVAVASTSLLLTPYAEGQLTLAGHAATIPTYWIAAPVLACAIHRGWRVGLLAAVAVGAVDVFIRVEPTTTTFGNVFLLGLSAIVVGYTASLVRLAAAERAEAAALASATTERERLARAVHDGVLQVLAYVKRRGAEIGGEATELAEVAGEQEEALRGLVSSSPVPSGDPREHSDVAAALQALAGSGVSMATPGEPVPLPAPVAGELVAAVREALGNAARHAPGAGVYVLLEDEGDTVTVSVRDDGPGIPAGRLAEAAAEGRLGVRGSIVRRVEDLGGTASVHAEPGEGTEWELRVPRNLGA